MNMPIPPSEAGLPEESRVLRVLHNQASRRTVAEVQLRGAPPLHRVYARSSGASRYELVGTPEEAYSFQDVVGCDASCIFGRITEWRKVGETLGGYDLGIFKVDFAGDVPRLLKLDLRNALPTGAFVSKVLRANDSGDSLQVVIAFREAGRARYAICHLDLTGCVLRELDTLPGVKF